MSRRHRYGVDLAPLIDVVFILLAFLLVYSRMDTSKAIEIALPEVAGETQEARRTPLAISIDAQGTLYLNTERLDADALAKRLAALPPETSVEIRTDKEAPAEALIRVMRLLSEANLSTADIAVGGGASGASSGIGSGTGSEQSSATSNKTAPEPATPPKTQDLPETVSNRS